MSVLNHTRTAPPDPANAAPLAPAGPPSTWPMTRVPLTRTGAVRYRIFISRHQPG